MNIQQVTVLLNNRKLHCSQLRTVRNPACHLTNIPRSRFALSYVGTCLTVFIDLFQMFLLINLVPW